MSKKVQAPTGLLVIVLCTLFFVDAGCVHRMIVDYMFHADGTVLFEGAPLSGAVVILDLEGVAYKAITPVAVSQTESDENGHFSFDYLAHSYHIPYTITFVKPGFKTAIVDGLSNTSNSYTINMVLENTAP